MCSMSDISHFEWGRPISDSPEFLGEQQFFSEQQFRASNFPHGKEGRVFTPACAPVGVSSPRAAE